MKRILSICFLTAILLSGCAGNSEAQVDLDGDFDKNTDGSVCPYKHKDSIIPIVYGYPTEEDFEKSDSGLIALGGCTLPDKPDKWFCKIHKVSF